VRAPAAAVPGRPHVRLAISFIITRNSGRVPF
jgi:hypothetical protein